MAAKAAVFIQEGREDDAQVRYTMAVELLGNPSHATTDFLLLSRAASKMAELATQATSASHAVKELDKLQRLEGWPKELKDILKSDLQSVQKKLPVPIEYRKCHPCGKSKTKDSSDNQWRTGKRKCIVCQGVGLVLSAAELSEAKERAEHDEAMKKRLEQLAKQRKVIDAELKERNETAPADNECVVCRRAEWGVSPHQTYKAVLPCEHLLCVMPLPSGLWKGRS